MNVIVSTILQYMFEVLVDDEKAWSVENTTPTKFEKVKVFAASGGHDPVDGVIKGLDIMYEKKLVK